MSKPHLLLSPWFICCFNVVVVFFLQVDAAFECNDTGVSFEMFHMHSPELKLQGKSLGTSKTRLDRFRELLEKDNARQQRLSSRRQPQRHMPDPTAELPLRSGSSTGDGVFYVSFRIGSPPQKFVLAADTGSDLTWMKCNFTCKFCPKISFNPGRAFQAKDSPSFRTIPCSSKICQEDLVRVRALPDCPTPDTPCLFNYTYFGGTSAAGVFVNETVTVGLHNRRKVILYNVLVGCTESANLPEPFPDGVMGLGFGEQSFAMLLAQLFGNKFSYCFVDHLKPSNFKNYLSFGQAQHSVPKKLQYTRLLVIRDAPYYWLNVTGISVGDKLLNIPAVIWSIPDGGGTIIDSGSSLTHLKEAAYNAVTDALRATISKFKKVELPVTEFCFEAKGFQEALAPKLVFHFDDGAALEPPVKSYIIDAAEGIKCLGFQKVGGDEINIIGNFIQQEHYWEYDIDRFMLGFGPSTCILPNPKD